MVRKAAQKVDERKAAREETEQKLFEEVQNKYLISQNESNAQVIRINETEQEIKRLQLVGEELKTFNDNDVLYQKHGRAFFISNKEGCQKKLQSDIDRKKAELPRMNLILAAFQNQFAEARQALTEIKISKPVLTGKVGV